MVHLLNMARSTNQSESWGNSAIYTTDDVSHNSISQYTKCSTDFHDGGFKLLNNCKGRYLMFGREAGGGMSDNSLLVLSIRIYSVINLLDGADLIEAP